MAKIRSVFLTILVTLTAGCTTTAKISKLDGKAPLSNEKVGAVFDFAFIDKNKSVGLQGCNLVVVRVDKIIQVPREIHFDAGKALVFVELDPGEYGFRQLRCGLESADLSFSKIPFFRVFEKKISLVGKVLVYLSSDERVGIKTFPDDPKFLTGILRTVGRTRPFQMPLVSAYSGQPLAQDKMSDSTN